MNKTRLKLYEYALLLVFTLSVFLICVCVGSVRIPPRHVFGSVYSALSGGDLDSSGRIITSVRLPRVMCAAFIGSLLSVCGAAMQGLLKNPLADGSVLGVSSGASLGAVLSIWLGTKIPFVKAAGTMPTAVLFAFLSLAAVLYIAGKIDFSLSTQTIILTGVIFSMFTGSITSLAVSFSGEKIKPIVFWTMGSLADSNYTQVIILSAALFVCSAVIFPLASELNALAVSEETAGYIGVNIKTVRLLILIFASAAIGICVSVSGTIGFVGLVVPHMTRLVTGPNHRVLLPACLFNGACFLMCADLLSRSVLSPRELPIGVITSLAGSCLFLFIFYKKK